MASTLPAESPISGREQQPDDFDDDYLSSDDEEQNLYSAHEREKPIHKELHNIISAIREDKVDWKSPAKVKSFFSLERWPHLLEKSEVKGNNLLHLLVMEQDIPGDLMTTRKRKAVEAVAKLWGILMSLQNDDHKTPIYLALENEKDALLTAMLRSKKVTLALETKCVDGQNCLHYALRSRKLRNRLLEDLVTKASRRAINQTDNKNWTPLHLAADYKESSEERLKLIRTLIHKGEVSVDDHLDGSEPAIDVYAGTENFSVYEYHLWTLEQKKKAIIKDSLLVNSKQVDEKKVPDWQPKKKPYQEEDIEAAPRKSEPQGKEKEGPLTNRVNTSAKVNPSRREEVPKDQDNQLLLPIKPLVRRRTVMFDSNVQEVQTGPDQRRTDADATAKELDKWSEEIRAELKLYCMRTRTIRQATRFLYGQTGDSKIHIALDYCSCCIQLTL